MKCLKCGELNSQDAKFCFKCGNKLEVSNVVTEPVKNVEVPNSEVQPTNSIRKEKKGNVAMDILYLFINPYKAFKDNEKKATETSKCLIFSGILIGAVTIIKLIVTMFSTVYHEEYSWYSGTTKTWDWSRLGDINYFKAIFLTIVVYAAVFAAISGIYCLASLILKKKTSFIRLLGMVNIALIPFLTASTLLSPIFSLLSGHIGVVITMVGLVLSIVTLITLINEELKVKDSMIRIYMHSACISILLLAMYICFVVTLTSAVTNSTLSVLG